ncbi:hypothetical protein [Achromobacter phage Motura]|uniref:Uncharacterized protein n=1 Tax=Achromobacter phage Motura TaxID=2591403 RepID=A0A514CSF4_9CAUD|nr:hypothetical protein H1O15_gp056 [Achromobacter phage Motura]QDH83406.1 hypothetical protein [Achromobacter phage Motura]
MILKAWGVLSHSPLVLSNALRSLGVSHSVIDTEQKIPVERRYDGLCAVQPAWPVIVDSITKVSKLSIIPDDPKILFVFDSRAALLQTNLKPLVLNDLMPDVQRALHINGSHEFKLVKREPSLLEFIDMATKPSVLRTLQTAWCKINPYAYRKEVQEAIILYIEGSRSFKATKAVLEKNLRAEAMLPTLKSDECAALIEAVRLYKAGANLDQICEHFNMESFDITYIVSARKKYAN